MLLRIEHVRLKPMQPFARLHEYWQCASALGAGPADSWAVFWRLSKNARVRVGIGAYHPDRVFTVHTRYGTLHLRDNFGDITNLPGLFWRKVYRPAPLAEPGAIVDIGANIGLAAALFAYYNPDRPIHCFEPLAANAALIPLNCPGAQVRVVALGAGPGRLRLNVDTQQVMASTVECPWPTRAVEFEVQPLDALAASDGLDQVALLKMDAEGMEVEILEGAAETLQRTARVVAETHGQGRHTAMLARLAASGFQITSQAFANERGLVFAERREHQTRVVSAKRTPHV
jgi:FkbM family methyltransferase